MAHNKHVTAVILAGGKSSRMGTDKGILPIQGKPMIGRIIDVVKTVVEDVVVIANNQNYHHFGLPVYVDIIKDIGPLGGIITAFVKSNADKILFLTCDSPFITRELLVKMIASCEDYQVVVPIHNTITEQFPVIYNRNCLAVMQQFADTRDFRLRKLNELFSVRKINVSKNNMFFNINTPYELKLAEDEV